MGVVNVVVEHPDNPATLFVGTEHHVFASTNVGVNWAEVPNLPTTHYDDMVIHPRDKDLVLGTHGQGIWILDDTRPIAEWANASAPVTVFSIPTGTIMVYKKDTSYRGQEPWAGANPVDGVEITYRLTSGAGSATMRVTNAAGQVVRTMTVPGGVGTHRVNWDLRHGLGDGAELWSRWESPVLARSIADRGPWVSPGTYLVTIESDGARAAAPVRVVGDPDMPITQAMYESRERFMLEALELTTQIEDAQRRAGFEVGGNGFRRAAEAPSTPEARLRAAHDRADDVFGALNGSAVRPGSLYPPTRAQRAQLLEARTLFEEAVSELGR
jgi:hypothetical protein